jgi:hypothetical protein
MEPIDALHRAVAERGLEWVFEQPDMLGDLLFDYCELRRPEIHWLVGSLKEQIPQRLLVSQSQTQKEAAAGQAREQLQISLGMAPEKAAWTVDAWQKILDRNNGAGKPALLAPRKEKSIESPTPIENRGPEEPQPIIRKSFEERCQEVMKKAFDEGEPIHIVAKLILPDDRRRGTAMAKAYWAGLSEAERAAIKKIRRAKGYAMTPQKVLFIVLLLVTVPFLVAYPVTWVFVYAVFPAMGFALERWSDLCHRVAAGDYAGAIPSLLVCAAIVFVIALIFRKRS